MILGDSLISILIYSRVGYAFASSHCIHALRASRLQMQLVPSRVHQDSLCCTIPILNAVPVGNTT